MTLPESMFVVAISRPGDPEVLQMQQAPLPPLGPHDILVRVAAAGVNGPDLAQRRGQYDPPAGASPLPGLEVSGEIVALGSAVTGWQLGASVMALTNGGGYAEYAAVPAEQALPIPPGWSTKDAAALPETWFTVTQTLVLRSQLEAGMSVLVHGAAGGIGGAAIQIATLLGARAIAVVSSAEKASYARHLGAATAINHTAENITERVLELTEGKGVDRVVDIIGGAMAETNIAVSARGGHIVQVSTLDNGSAKLSLRAIMAKQLTLSGSTLRPQTAATKAAIASHIRTALIPLLTAPDFVRQRVTAYRMEDAAEAHQVMEARGHIGKIVLTTPFCREQLPIL